MKQRQVILARVNENNWPVAEQSTVLVGEVIYNHRMKLSPCKIEW